MSDSSKKLRLSPKQSTDLLRLSLGRDEDEQNQAADHVRADLLIDTLKSKVPIDPMLLESLPADDPVRFGGATLWARIEPAVEALPWVESLP